MDDALLERLRLAAKRTAELETAAQRERERRDALIIEARDAGLPWRRIAAAAAKAVSTCETIVSRR